MTTSMTEKVLLQRASAVKFVLGLLLLTAAFFMPAFGALFPAKVAMLGLAAIGAVAGGMVTLGFSLADLAESKGHPREYGLLVGLGLIGLIWAVLLPDRNRDREWIKPNLTW